MTPLQKAKDIIWKVKRVGNFALAGADDDDEKEAILEDLIAIEQALTQLEAQPAPDDRERALEYFDKMCETLALDIRVKEIFDIRASLTQPQGVGWRTIDTLRDATCEAVLLYHPQRHEAAYLNYEASNIKWAQLWGAKHGYTFWQPIDPSLEALGLPGKGET